MKVMSYTCDLEKLEEKRTWLINHGFTVFRQVILTDYESPYNRQVVRFTFFVPNKETETYIAITFPKGTFQDCSA